MSEAEPPGGCRNTTGTQTQYPDALAWWLVSFTRNTVWTSSTTMRVTHSLLTTVIPTRKKTAPRTTTCMERFASACGLSPWDGGTARRRRARLRGLGKKRAAWRGSIYHSPCDSPSCPQPSKPPPRPLPPPHAQEAAPPPRFTHQHVWSHTRRASAPAPAPGRRPWPAPSGRVLFFGSGTTTRRTPRKHNTRCAK